MESFAQPLLDQAALEPCVLDEALRVIDVHLLLEPPCLPLDLGQAPRNLPPLVLSDGASANARRQGERCERREQKRTRPQKPSLYPRLSACMPHSCI